MKQWPELYRAVREELACGRKAAVVTRLIGGGQGLMPVEKTLYTQAQAGLSELGGKALEAGALQLSRPGAGETLFAEPYLPPARLIVLGGGHIAVPLCEFAAKCGFLVTVVDDRPLFADPRRFPLAHRVLCAGFEDCLTSLGLNAYTFVVIITRGHAHDLDCLRQALGAETAYLGMIGSRRRVELARRQLAEEGFAPAAVAAVNAPIGLSIGALTPPEIAVSILAQLIEYKRLRCSVSWPELDTDVLDELCRDGGERRAVATILEARGSTPREPGAKMIIWPDGRILGSIGGGCGESDVVRAAMDVMDSGLGRIVEVDMTGETAENDGMVCGGTMRIAVEPLPE